MPKGLVNFLDSGDSTNPEPILFIDSNPGFELYSFSSNITYKDKSIIRKPIDIKYIDVICPFFLGSVFINQNSIHSGFPGGRREDWKFWTEIINSNNKIKVRYKSSIIAYDYAIKDKYHHFRRKISIIKDQYNFYKDFKNYSTLKSFFYTIIYYTLQSFMWVFTYR